MKRTKSTRSTIDLTSEQLKQLRNDRALIARELPDLAAKHQRLCDAAEEPTHSGALRRAVHASKMLLDDLAVRAGTDLDTLDGFLTGQFDHRRLQLGRAGATRAAGGRKAGHTPAGLRSWHRIARRRRLASARLGGDSGALARMTVARDETSVYFANRLALTLIVPRDGSEP